jgi:ribosome biogenesis protein UTP30
MGAQSKVGTSAGVIDSSLVNRAVSALLKHHSSTTESSNQLLDDELDVQVQFTLARVPGEPSPKPIRIDIPHPLVKVDGKPNDENNLQEAAVCLIVKEESKPLVQEMIARFPEELSCIKKVLGLQSLRTKHKSFSQKRELLARFDVFLADDRILPMLTKALGNKFFEKKKQPVPINICRKEALPFAVQRCLRGTFMYLSSGTCVTIKAGNTSMSPSHLQANINGICTQAPLKVPRKWANIKSISIKTTSSVALPIYNKTLEELEEIRADAGIADGCAADKEEIDGDTEEEEKKRKQLSDKSPLARALKKQKSTKKEKLNELADAVAEEETVALKTPKEKKVNSTHKIKSSSKKSKGKQLEDDSIHVGMEGGSTTETPKKN